VIKEQKAKRAQEAQSSQNSGDVTNKVGTDVSQVAKSNQDDVRKRSPHPIQSTTSSTNTSSSASKISLSGEQQQPNSSGKQSMKPISTTAVPGTPWCVVWTDKNRVFYFNPSTKTSVWERPGDLRGREDVDKMVSTPPANLTALSQNSSSPSSSSIGGSQVSTKNKLSPTSESHLVQKKPKLQSDQEPNPDHTSMSISHNESSPVAKPTLATNPKVIKKETVSEIEKEAAKKRDTIPIEERIATFRAMLEEKQVNPSSTFQRELSKIVFDPRYLLLTSSERREVFDKFCTEKNEEEQRSRRERIKAITNEFKKLLTEANLTSRSTFEEFHEAYSKDPRYKALEKTKDREILFDDHLAYLRRKEREERSQQMQLQQAHRHHSSSRRSHSRHRSSSRSVPREEAEGVYQALLVELITDLDLTWHDAKRIMRKSPQWDYVSELGRDWMETMFEKHLDKIYCRRKEKFQQLLSETREVTLGSEWRDIKRIIRDDPRYIKFASCGERRCEREFREVVKRKTTAAEEQFRQLLRETKLIDKDSRRKIEESEHQHLIDIISTLRDDKRYKDLEPISEERRKILLSYIDELATASPSTDHKVDNSLPLSPEAKIEHDSAPVEATVSVSPTPLQQ